MKKKIKDSLAAKIFLLALCLLLLCSFATCFLISLLMPKSYSLYLNNSLDKKVQQFISVLETVNFSNSGALFDSFLENPSISSIKLMDEYGFFIEPPTQTPPREPAAVILQEAISSFVYDTVYSALSDTSTSSYAVEQEDEISAYLTTGLAQDVGTEQAYYNHPLTMQSYPFTFADTDVPFRLLVYGNSQPISQFKQVFLKLMPLLLVLTVLIAVLAASLFSYIVTKPIRKISGIAQKMSQLSLDWYCDGKRTDELGILERSLNTLSQNLSAALSGLQTANRKLQDDMEKEKQFFSAVSHELKTPITVIKGQLEGMLFDIGAYKDHKKYLARSLAVAGTLETMVQEILTVSRLETAPLSHSRFNIAPVIKECLISTEDLIVSRELTLHTEIQTPCFVTGSQPMLSKVIGNLISNAIFYSPPENEIFILSNSLDGRFSFQIENTGVHIPEDSLNRIFEAFYRVEQSRNRRTGGSGLGLYIVQKILEQHNACCHVRNTRQGVCFSFELDNR